MLWLSHDLAWSVLSRDIDERTRTYDERKQRGELNAVEQMIEVSRSRRSGESQQDTFQRLFGAAESKRDSVDQSSQEIQSEVRRSVEGEDYIRRASNLQPSQVRFRSLEETREIRDRGQVTSEELRAEVVTENIANDRDGDDNDDEGGSTRPEEKPPHEPEPPVDYDSSSSSDGGRKRGRGKIGRFGFTVQDGELQFADDDGLLSFFEFRSNAMDNYEFPELF